MIESENENMIKMVKVENWKIGELEVIDVEGKLVPCTLALVTEV